MILRLRDRELTLAAGEPLLMGIVNANPDSFSDSQGEKDPAALVQHGLGLGSAIVDVGGLSGRTDKGVIPVEEEISRVVPVVAPLAAAGLIVSVDTWRAPVARAAVEAGAALVNDMSGLSDPGVAEVCAETGAGLVITHTRADPKQKAFEPYEGDVVAEVARFLARKADAAVAAGVARERLVLDPGLDVGKDPGHSVEILARLEEIAKLGRPLLLAISRKDFLGAITGRAPADRGASTLAAIEPALECPAPVILRVHDVAAARDFVSVRLALRAGRPVGTLAAALRREAG